MGDVEVSVNLFSANPEGLSIFYAELFGFEEIRIARSSIYRALRGANSQIGFNAFDAYELLDIANRKPAEGAEPREVVCYCSFKVEAEEAVAQLADRAVKLGGRVVKQPYVTYYGQCQSVIADPEDNIFRISFQRPGRTAAEPHAV